MVKSSAAVAGFSRAGPLKQTVKPTLCEKPVRPTMDIDGMTEGEVTAELQGHATEDEKSEDAHAQEQQEEEFGSARPKVMRNPGCPTKQEVEDHMITHLPYW